MGKKEYLEFNLMKGEKMRITKLFLLLLICAVSVSILSAQITRQTGTLRGTVTDPEGVPLPRVTVTTTSPALLGSIADVTGGKGTFRLVALPPGTYLLVVELGGFKTIRREELAVSVGMTITINIMMEPSEIKEEITVTAAAPTVDIQTTKIANVMSAEVLRRLPLARKMNDAISAAAGVVGQMGYTGGIVHGATAIMHNWEIDGININSPTHNAQMIMVHYDAIEEVEMVTGGLPASVGVGGGSYINVVTKSGGNEFHGQMQAYYTRESLTQILYPEEQITAMGVGKPSSPIFDWDVSGSLGGPVIQDKLWFFLDLGLLKNEKIGGFQPTTILGTRYEAFNFPETVWQGMFKLTSQLSRSMRFFLMVHAELENRDIYNTWSTRNTKEACWTIKNNHRIASTANLSWHMSPNTIFDIRAGLARRYFPISHQEGTNGLIGLSDGFTGYNWNSPSGSASVITRQSRQASARLTHFQDDFLGADHEIGIGIEWQWGEDDWVWYRKTPLDIQYYDGNIYYYRGLYGLDAPHPIYGDGRVSGMYGGPEKGDSLTNGSEKRYSLYIQDSMTFNNRLTLNLGVRFDNYTGYLPPGTKAPTEGVIKDIGDYVLTPMYGFNPYGQLTFDGWDNAMGWTSISPRLGASYDLFGDGKTALKVSFARYAEALPVMYFNRVHPHQPDSFGFYWWDTNGNQQVDAPGVDDYTYRSGDVKMMDLVYNKQTIDPDATSPYYNEFTASITNELFQDFRITLQYLYKNKIDAIDDVLYDPDTNKYWYHYDLAPEWWVPFTTTVPGIGEFEDQQVTLYFMSLDSPYDDQFRQLTNVPEAKRTYQAVELTFDKRYSKGWSLGGSIVWSVTKGNNSGSYGSVWGFGGAYNQANYFVNRYGKTNNDVPLAVKIYGSFDLPLGLVTSFYYTHAEGTAWQRTVTVYPPADWATANNAVPWSAGGLNVETQGSRREQSSDNIDFRLEKEFYLPMGKIGLFVDVFNLLGNRYIYSGLNPGGNWTPEAEGTNVGTYAPSYNYGRITSIGGTRIFKFSIRFTF